MKRFACLMVFVALAASVLVLRSEALLRRVAFGAGATVEKGLNMERVKAVTAMLSERPTGLGRPITDRAAWERLAADKAYQQAIRRTEQYLTEPLPDQPDDLFLEFTRTGNRTHWERVAFQRRGRLTWLVLAECFENKGRFVPAIEQLLNSLCAERTWVFPACDGALKNFNGTEIDVDLISSAMAWNFATADYLLGDKLSPTARQQLRDNVRRRVLDPYRAMFTGARKPNWWMLGTNNWNAVCLAGVTGAGLAQIESREERAQFVVAAEKYSRNFLAGFTSDGYCSEGLGYWNYGFGHYLLLAETVRQATSGGVDLLALPEVKAPATFGARIQIVGGVSPAFADCSVKAQPSPAIMYFVNRRFGLGLREYDELDPKSTLGSLFEAMIYAFPNAASQTPPAKEASRGPGLRSWFEQAGVLIGRPAEGSSCRMGVALKGGHNAEHHNHNDVGSYVVVVGERPVLLDPGAETYTARTFSKRRYESKLLNSSGHPVPVVAGQLQRAGREAHAKVLRADFGDKADTLQIDIASAYPVPDLKTLERTFVYSREGSGCLTVTDHVEFKTPQSFGTALITLGEWKRLPFDVAQGLEHVERPDRALLIYDFDEALRAEISAGGAEFTIQPEAIHEDAPVTPTRLGINLAQPVLAATITVRIAPTEMTDEKGGGGLLRNGGFELGNWCWNLPKDGFAAISTEQAASGQCSLKITDHNKKNGSNVSSARIPIAGAASFTLRGKVYHVMGRGVGVYVRFLNAGKEIINTTDARGGYAPIASLAGAVGRWETFALPFQTPPETAAIQLWIHSGNAAEVEAYLDDLEIVRTDTK